jgi:hypothetical protein
MTVARGALEERAKTKRASGDAHSLRASAATSRIGSSLLAALRGHL